MVRNRKRVKNDAVVDCITNNFFNTQGIKKQNVDSEAENIFLIYPLILIET